MIVKVIKAGAEGHGRALVHYVLDLKGERRIVGLGEDVLDLKHAGEKVEWARTVNTGVDEPRWAFKAIERHNAQNTHKHRISRYQHIIVSFVEGERPDREQMAIIEDRLMQAIGFGDHPRVSAVHKNTDNWHLHIAVSRIDPTTLKAEHPRHNHFALQAEAARLEVDLGLRQERKTLLRRERAEIECRRSLAPEPPTPPLTPAQRLQSIGDMHDRVTAITEKGVEQARQVIKLEPQRLDQVEKHAGGEVVEEPDGEAVEKPTEPAQRAFPTPPHPPTTPEPEPAWEAPSSRHAARQRAQEEPSLPPSPTEQRQLELTQAAIRWRRELGKAEWVLQRRQEAVEVAQYRLQERWEAMGSIRRGMFRLGVDDQDHKRWRDELARAQRGADRAGTRVKAAADRLETIEAERERLRREQAAQAYWRQTMAQGERERLSERVEQRQHERQTRRLRL